jgi:hypothetical protein
MSIGTGVPVDLLPTIGHLPVFGRDKRRGEMSTQNRSMNLFDFFDDRRPTKR